MLASNIQLTDTKIRLKLFSRAFNFYVILTLCFLIGAFSYAQETSSPIINNFADSLNSSDTSEIVADSLLYHFTDSLTQFGDTLEADTIPKEKKEKKSPIEDKVDYSAKDSMQMDITNQKAYLYGEAKVNYLDIQLTADYIEFDMAKQEVFASGVTDTTNAYIGRPNFVQGNQEFDSDSLKYNFKTERGIIYEVMTEEGEGYLHSSKTKRESTGHIHVQGGKYTTCNEEHPHFYMALSKAMVIPDDKIIAGPSYLVVEDVPVPLGIPFGFFPNTRSRSSGILIPSYGQELNRGYYLRDGGWYQVLGDYADLTLRGTYYTKGTWSVRSTLSYKWRYHFSGSFAAQFSANRNNWEEDFTESNDYKIIWSHRQDAKANPTQNFSANVNFSSTEFEKNHGYSTQDYLTNQKSSSINYSKSWPGTPFNLSLSALATQNSETELTEFDMPSGSFNINRIYPFRKKESTGKKKWYEDIGFNYSSQFQTESEVYDSVMFTDKMFDTVDFGLSHTIPFSINIKTGKLFTISPSLSYTGTLNNFYAGYEVATDTNNNEYVREYRVNEFTYAHAIKPSIGASFTPKFFGTFTNKRKDGYVEAVRHVIYPKISASYTPDMKRFSKNYYDTLYTTDTAGNVTRHIVSKYSGSDYRTIYGAPSAAGQSGSITFGLSNNLEMKVHPKNDTTGEGKKVSILENFNFSTSYNPFAEEKKWSAIAMTAGTKILDKKMNIRCNGRFSLYDLDSTYTEIDEFLFKNTGQLARLTSLSFTVNYSLKSNTKKKDTEAKTQEEEQLGTNVYQDPLNPDLEFVPGYSSGDVVDFDIPWSLNFSFSWSYSKPTNVITRQSTMRLNGDFSLTPKWKIGFNSGYDIMAKEITFTNFSVHRDLHCWEMQIRVVPFGNRKSYFFTIKAKSSLLRDLKWDKNQYWYDKF